MIIDYGYLKNSVLMMKENNMLTKRQKEVLNTIETFIKNNGYSPTYRDIAQMLSMKHVSSVFEIVRKLDEKGYVTTNFGEARSIRIIKKEL